MKKALLACFLSLVLVLSCLPLSLLAEPTYPCFSVTSNGYYYHRGTNLFAFETGRAGTTFTRTYSVYNATDHDVYVSLSLMDPPTWYLASEGPRVLVPAGDSATVSTAAIAVDGDNKVTYHSGKTSAQTTEPLTGATLRVDVFLSLSGWEDDSLLSGEKLYFTPTDAGELAFMQNNAISSAADFARETSLPTPPPTPTGDSYVGWSMSAPTTLWHMISGVFSFETDRAGTTFTRRYEIYNHSSQTVRIGIEVADGWAEFFIGTDVTIPAGDSATVETKPIVVAADGTISNGTKSVLLTNAQIRFNTLKETAYELVPFDGSLTIVPLDARELQWLQESEPSGTLGATVKRVKEIGTEGMKVKVDFSDPNLMISGRYTESSSGARTISFQAYTELNFTGTSVSVRGSGSCYVEIDGVPKKSDGSFVRTTLNNGSTVLAKDLAPGNHRVRLYSTGQRCNYTVISFSLDPGAETLPPDYTKTVEFIGSSSLVAYTNPNDPHDGYDSGTSYMISFGYQTGKLLEKDGFRFNTVAFGGSGVVAKAGYNGESGNDYLTMQDRYQKDREYLGSAGAPEAAPGAWDTSKYVPDYLVLYLGANDLGQGETVFKTNYKKFIDDLLGYYPSATVIAMAPYNVDSAYARALSALVATYDSPQVQFIDSTNWGITKSTYDNLHTTAAQHAVLAERLYAVLKAQVFGEPALGDLNADGTVDASDLTALARIVAKIDTASTAQEAAADVDKNGTVTADDLTLMARYVARIVTSFD